MEANSYTRVIFESPAALRVWCIAAGLALAPLPAIHALPEAFLYYLLESPPPGWTRITFSDARFFFIARPAARPDFPGLGFAQRGPTRFAEAFHPPDVFLGCLQSASIFFRKVSLWRNGRQSSRRLRPGFSHRLDRQASRYAVADRARCDGLTSATYTAANRKNPVPLDPVRLRNLGRRAARARPCILLGSGRALHDHLSFGL